MVYQVVRSYVKRETVIAESEDIKVAKEVVSLQRAAYKATSARYCGRVYFSVKMVTSGELIKN